MDSSGTGALVRRYYEAWAARDLDAARACLAEDLDFRSPDDRFTTADDFLAACWRLSEGLTGVEFLREVYGEDRAFVLLRWMVPGSPEGFAGAEYLGTRDGRVSEILVVSYAPELSGLAE